jgi:VWFA-related protein
MLVTMMTLPAMPGAAQEQEEEGMRRIGGLTFVDEIQLTIANLIVYVTDKKGWAVTDLTVDDFEVFQDGQQKEITNFKLYTDEVIRSEFQEEPTTSPMPTPSKEPAAAAPAGPQPVNLVLYIDNENLEPMDRNRVLRQTRQFVRDSLHPPARMMVVAYQRSFKVLQEFTSDPSEVLAAMREVGTYTGGRSERNSARNDILEEINRLSDEGAAGGRRGQSSGSDWGRVYSQAESYAQETAHNLQFTMDSLRQIITSLSGLPGKKGIIYVSNGLPMTPGMEIFYEISRATHESGIMTKMFEYDRSRLYQNLAATANSQNVTFYTIDAEGLSTFGMGAAESRSPTDPVSAAFGRHNYTDSLRYLADETGGLAIINTNDISGRLELLKQDLFTYYSIGYPLQASGHDKIHKVKVKLRDDPAFSGYELRYRSRFVEKSLETRVQDAVVSSLVFEIDDNPMGVEVETGVPMPAAEKRWLLPAHISFPLGNVAMLPEGDDYVARVVLFIAARDSDGKQSDLVRQEHEVRIPADRYEDAKNTSYRIDTRLLMESGRYKVSVALLDPLTRQDSYRTVTASVHPDS